MSLKLTVIAVSMLAVAAGCSEDTPAPGSTDPHRPSTKTIEGSPITAGNDAPSTQDGPSAGAGEPVLVLDAAAVERGVTSMVAGSYNVTVDGKVICPQDQAVTLGNTFDCQLSIKGKPRTVRVTITSADGSYTVGPPR